MMRRPALSLLLLATGLLAACASRPPGTPEAPSAPRAADSPGRGIYKIGTPYQIGGVWYRPAEDFSYEETGIASWYGEDFHGKYTANGEIFDLNALTAAHRTLPMPCVVQVTNLENGRMMALRVNDRGPYARGRIIDVSRRAAQLLGFEGQGTAKVRVRILVPESIEVASLARRNGGDGTKILASDDLPQAAPREPVLTEPLTPATGLRFAATESPGRASEATPSLAPAPPTPAAIAPPPLPEQVTVLPVTATQIFIQVGAYAVAENAFRVKGRVDSLGAVKIYGARVRGIDLYRVRLGPIGSVGEADQLLDRVLATGLTEARIVID